MLESLDNGRAADQPRAELLLGKLLLRRQMGTRPTPARPRRVSERACGQEVAARLLPGAVFAVATWARSSRRRALDHLLDRRPQRPEQRRLRHCPTVLLRARAPCRPVNAYVFSQLARGARTPRRPMSWPRNCRAQLPVERQAQARSLLQQEQQLAHQPEPERPAPAGPAKPTKARKPYERQPRRHPHPNATRRFSLSQLGLTWAWH